MDTNSFNTSVELFFAFLMVLLSFRVLIARRFDTEIYFARYGLSAVIALYAMTFAVPYIVPEFRKAAIWIEILRYLCLFSLFIYATVLKQHGSKIINKD